MTSRYRVKPKIDGTFDIEFWRDWGYQPSWESCRDYNSRADREKDWTLPLYKTYNSREEAEAEILRKLEIQRAANEWRDRVKRFEEENPPYEFPIPVEKNTNEIKPIENNSKKRSFWG